MIEHVIVHVIANRPEYPLAAQIRGMVRRITSLISRAWKPQQIDPTPAPQPERVA